MKLTLKNKSIVFCLAVSPDGKWLAVGQEHNQGKPALSLFDTATWKFVAGFETGDDYPVSRLAFNRHSTELAYTIKRGQAVKFLDLTTLTTGEELKVDNTADLCYARHKDLLLINGKHVKVLDDKRSVLWQSEDYTFENQFSRNIVGAVFCNDDTRVMITGNGNDQFSIVDIATGKLLNTLPGGFTQVDQMLTDPAEKYLLIGGTRPIGETLLELETMKPLAPERYYAKPTTMNAYCFHPSSAYLAYGAVVGSVRLVSLEDKKISFEPQEVHKDRVSDIAFTRDGNTMISGSFDRTVLLTDISTFIK